MFSTDERNQPYLPEWVILGDHSRSVFLQWILSGSQLKTEESSVIWIRHGLKIAVTQNNAHWLIETPDLLPEMTLCLPPTDELTFDLITTKMSRYAVIEAFPFRKQSSIDLIQQLERQGHETLIVLMDLPRHQGSTDLIAPGEDLNQAIELYRKDRRNVSVMRNADDLNRVLHWHQPIYDVWVGKARNYLADMGERIAEIPYDYPLLEEDWKEENGPLQEETIDGILSFERVKSMTENNLWDRYAVASRQALFPSNGRKPLLPVADLYRECLDNPLVFWSAGADAEEFMVGLLRAFDKTLERREAMGCYRRKTLLQTGLDEQVYYSFVARNGRSGTALNAMFRKIITDFLCYDVKKYLLERLRLRYEELEAMINCVLKNWRL